MILFLKLLFLYCHFRAQLGVYKTILEHIGNTPMVKLDRIKKDHGLKCDLCELKLLHGLRFCLIYAVHLYYHYPGG